MNNKQIKYQSRAIEPVLRQYLTLFPAIGVTGPRQSGKSTLLQEVLSDYRYISFDDYQICEFFEQDPVGFMETYDDKVIFDEVQKMPKLFNMVKIAVDKDRARYGKFILTGSSQFSLLKHISESLAGRIGLLTLLPFQISELPKSLLKLDPNPAIYRGSYPELVKRDYNGSEQWYASYLDTYLNKDLRQIANIGNLLDFKRLLHLLAANASQVLNYSSYAKALGVSVPTIKTWLSVLEASYIIFLLPPFYDNLGKRVTKSPKLYFYDTGLVAFLTKIKNKELYDFGPMSGALFENYVISEAIKLKYHTNQQYDLFYYRSSNGLEVDLIIDYGDKKDWIEIKKSSTFTPKMAATIEQLKQKEDNGFVLYNGKGVEYKSNIRVLNYLHYLR